MRDKVISFFRRNFSLMWDKAENEDIHQAITSGANIKGTNMCILILAILIASVGLNMNSTAVIIGAMLISPLMGGIMAVGYGIATNNLSLARRAAIGLAFQIFICIVSSTIYFAITPISTACSELLARTNPTIWDVIIAVCGGTAGMIGVTRKEKTNVIPGVAIATALMPPLCTAGYGIATMQLKYFLGAMYLFFINTFFICLSTLIVAKILHLPSKHMVDAKATKKPHRNIAIITIITVIPSIYFAYQLVKNSIVDNNISQYLATEFTFSNTQLVQSSVDKETGEIEVAVIGQTLDEDTIKDLSSKLSNYGLSNMSLKITQTALSQGVTLDQLQAIIDKNKANTDVQVNDLLKEQEIEDLKKQIENYQAIVEKYKQHDFDMETITQELKAMFPEIVSINLGLQKEWDDSSQKEQDYILAFATTSRQLSKGVQNRILNWLKVKTNSDNLQLIAYEQEQSESDNNSTSQSNTTTSSGTSQAPTSSQ